MKFANIILIAAIALGVLFLSGLGVWQMKRLAWKEALIARVESNLTAPPQSLLEIRQMQQRGEDIEYRPVRLVGIFDHSREQHFFATHKGNPGYFVYTPLQLESGEYIFVNRGYVPLQGKAIDSRMEGQVAGNIELAGLSRSAPAGKPNSFVPDNDLKKNVYHWKSLSQMQSRAFQSGGEGGEGGGGEGSVTVLPFFVDADDAANPGGLPKGGVTLIKFPNSHLQYALTWFGLAGALLAVGGYFLFGRMRRN
ncbi:MAG: SURF1 family protein [Rhizobiaceae bacterium]